MSDPDRSGRSLLATVVGYAIVAIIAVWLLGAVAGVVFWLVKAVVVVALLLGLIALYLKLKTPKDA